MSRQLRFLIVDDDKTSRLALEKTLDQHGQVEEADGGVEALAFFRNAIVEKNPFHLVTLDVDMPVLDGMATLELMRGLEVVHRSLPKAKVLMITGVSDPQLVIKTLRLGSEGYLLKPIDQELLDAKVREIFGMPLSVEQKAKLASGAKRRPAMVEK